MYVVDKPLKLREVMTTPVSVSISTMFQISYRSVKEQHKKKKKSFGNIKQPVEKKNALMPSCISIYYTDIVSMPSV